MIFRNCCVAVIIYRIFKDGDWIAISIVAGTTRAAIPTAAPIVGSTDRIVTIVTICLLSGAGAHLFAILVMVDYTHRAVAVLPNLIFAGIL